MSPWNFYQWSTFYNQSNGEAERPGTWTDPPSDWDGLKTHKWDDKKGTAQRGTWLNNHCKTLSNWRQKDTLTSKSDVRDSSDIFFILGLYTVDMLMYTWTIKRDRSQPLTAIVTTTHAPVLLLLFSNKTFFSLPSGRSRAWSKRSALLIHGVL